MFSFWHFFKVWSLVWFSELFVYRIILPPPPPPSAVRFTSCAWLAGSNTSLVTANFASHWILASHAGQLFGLAGASYTASFDHVLFIVGRHGRPLEPREQGSTLKCLQTLVSYDPVCVSMLQFTTPHPPSFVKTLLLVWSLTARCRMCFCWWKWVLLR